VALQQGFATGEMGSMTNLRCKNWLFSNSGRALALPATDAAVLGTSARYVPNDMAFPLAVCGRV
jgi:hypothetical protein